MFPEPPTLSLILFSEIEKRPLILTFACEGDQILLHVLVAKKKLVLLHTFGRSLQPRRCIIPLYSRPFFSSLWLMITSLTVSLTNICETLITSFFNLLFNPSSPSSSC